MRTPGLLVVASTGLVLTAGLIAATTAGAQTSPTPAPEPGPVVAAPAQDWSADPWAGGDFSGPGWPWATGGPDPAAGAAGPTGDPM